MSWAKPSDALVAAFTKAIPDDPRVERRAMFGFPAAFVKGRLFMGLHEERLVFRFGEEDARAFERKWGTALFEPRPGRPMKGWRVAPPALVTDAAELRAWARRALEHGHSLPGQGRATGRAKRASAIKRRPRPQ